MPTPEKTLQEVVQGFRDKAREILSEMPTFKKKYLDTLHRLYNFG